MTRAELEARVWHLEQGVDALDAAFHDEGAEWSDRLNEAQSELYEARAALAAYEKASAKEGESD